MINMSDRPTIAVYTCARQEELHVPRWAEAANGADSLYILDTGSTDRTVEIAESYGVRVTRAWINPWRFDDARNAALALIQSDIDVCVSVDMDEVLHPGWREIIEDQYQQGVNIFNAEFVGGVVYAVPRGHTRTNFRWSYPCHEIIVPNGDQKLVGSSRSFHISHHPDESKPRSHYRDLLETGYRENPDARSTMYLARELVFYGEKERAVRLFREYLDKSTWQDERSAAMLRISELCPSDREGWILDACSEAPWRREPWVSLAAHCADAGDWPGALSAARRAVAITVMPVGYFCEPYAWGPIPHDIAARAAWELGLKEEALSHGEAALSIDPSDLTLQRNMKIYASGQRQVSVD